MRAKARVPLLFVVVLLTVLGGWSSGQWLARQLAMDGCLDGGGCWDVVLDRCSDVQAECDRGRR